ncbi:MAG: large conductance mechanosensitive channel protein MscL [Erysipelotrichaceae bacterium]|nr:large conductance mechanosensitive channel protein MscL [Erysipelotrichaceae bacterium]MBQ5804602.1 large conductance mechanosensitive channel protein MscL [Erysipelotrichaceae bacterium]
MKKFLEEFKDFALKGNVMDMAVGVIVGGAFSSIVTALTEDILNPIISCIGGTEIGLVTKLGNTGQVIDWGSFLSSVINFLIMAFVLFTILKAINKLTSLTKKEADEAPKEEPEPSEEVKLLTEIAGQLKKLNKK